MLDLFFRKYAWTANLVLVFAAAWLSAKTVNTLVGVLIRPRPEVDLQAVSAPPPRPSLPASLDTDAIYRLIGQQPPRAAEMPVANVPQSPQNCEDLRAAPTKSDLRMQLIAGIIADRPRFSLATVNDLTTRETHVLGVGDQIGAVQLLGVERVRDDHDATGNGFRVVAIICNGGTKEYLDFDPAADGAPHAISYAPVPPPRGGACRKLDGIRQTADNRYEIDRSVLASTLGDQNQSAPDARTVASLNTAGQPGFR